MMDMALDMRDSIVFVPDPRPGKESEHVKVTIIKLLPNTK